VTSFNSAFKNLPSLYPYVHIYPDRLVSFVSLFSGFAPLFRSLRSLSSNPPILCHIASIPSPRSAIHSTHISVSQKLFPYSLAAFPSPHCIVPEALLPMLFPPPPWCSPHSSSTHSVLFQNPPDFSHYTFSRTFSILNVWSSLQLASCFLILPPPPSSAVSGRQAMR